MSDQEPLGLIVGGPSAHTERMDRWVFSSAAEAFYSHLDLSLGQVRTHSLFGWCVEGLVE